MSGRTAIIVMLVVLVASGAAFAEENERQRPTKKQILEKFDTDGDGKLSESERKAAREAMKKKREENGDGEGRRGGRRRGRGGNR